MENWFESAEKLFGVKLSEEQREQFRIYEALLIDWNSKINLTAVRDPEGIRIKHFLDSLSCVPVLGDMNGSSLIDIGTGAGFPGIPLRIVYPGLRLTLVDSVGKKADFCQLVVNTLHLKGVKVLKDRSEELGAALEKRQIVPWLQPIVDRAGKIIGAEVLVRWIHPEEGIRSPISFIPMFEKNGMIADVDRYMWRKACEILNK